MSAWCGARKSTRSISSGRARRTCCEGELRLVAIDFDAGLDFDEVVAIDVFGDGFEKFPHAGFDGAAAVAEFEAEIGLALRACCEFLFRGRGKKW